MPFGSLDRFLRSAAFALTAIMTALGTAFVAGETFDDPGGMAAVGLIASWVLPMAALIAVAWFWPSIGLRLFVALTALSIAVTAWAATDPGAWRHMEDHHGPVRALVVFVLSAAIGAFGLRRPRAAGWLLIALAFGPIALSVLGGRLGVGSLGAAAAPACLVGLLYLASAHLARPSPPTPRRHGLRIHSVSSQRQ